jgi:hypothetical protein
MIPPNAGGDRRHSNFKAKVKPTTQFNGLHEDFTLRYYAEAVISAGYICSCPV